MPAKSVSYVSFICASRACATCLIVVGLAICKTALGVAPEFPKTSADCTVELDLPEGTRVVVDGKDYDQRRTLTFQNLSPGREYTSIIELKLERGALAQRKVKIRAGSSE